MITGTLSIGLSNINSYHYSLDTDRLSMSRKIKGCALRNIRVIQRRDGKNGEEKISRFLMCMSIYKVSLFLHILTGCFRV
jgi:hypothetical protein